MFNDGLRRCIAFPEAGNIPTYDAIRWLHSLVSHKTSFAPFDLAGLGASEIVSTVVVVVAMEFIGVKNGQF